MSLSDENEPGRRDGGEESVLLPRRSDGTPLRCLVVEDEELIALDLGARLEDWGVESEIAPTAGAALRMLAERRPDFVLMDVRLPDGDGIELAARMRAFSVCEIVFVTGMADPGTARRIRALGDFAIVLKPIDYRSLRRALCRVLARPRGG